MGRKKGTVTYSEKVKKEVLDRIKNGEILKKVADETGISRQTIITWKQKEQEEQEKIKVVPKGDYEYGEEFKQRVIKEVQKGTAIPEVAKIFGICEQPIKRWIADKTLVKKTKTNSSSIEVAIRNLSDEISKVDLVLSDEKSIIFKIWRQK